MKVNLENAVSLFYKTSSLEMVYIEAVANAIDANATNIRIDIKISSFSEPESLEIIISDNGEGFNERNFEKFSELLKVEEDDHKGLGRLVYLEYFKSVNIESNYDQKKRKFVFNSDFDGESEIFSSSKIENNTNLKFEGYKKEKIKSYEYLKPTSLKESILENFFPIFHSKNKDGEKLKITISLDTKENNESYRFFSDTAVLDISELPELEFLKFSDDRIDLIDEFELYYTISRPYEETSVITALCVDGRTFKLDILDKESIPAGYELIFLLYSEYFKGKVTPSRRKLSIDDEESRTIRSILKEKVTIILDENIPEIEERNRKVRESLDEKYPHLVGFFNGKSVGLINRSETLEIAQKKFFNTQKEVLESKELDDDLYRKSLDVSSRLLTEYILYRKKIIEKLKKINPNNDEADIHSMIVPMRKVLNSDNKIHDIYTNNAWLLDDKYMSYTTILSDKRMDDLIDEIEIETAEEEKDDKRPDISIVFSGDPQKEEKVDVVIVELKKLGLDLKRKVDVITQLRERARKLLKYYPNKIQRIWFYGIVDFDDEMRIHLKEDSFTELFSKGELYYKQQKILTELDDESDVTAGLFVMSFETLILDADARNSTFLEILKDGIKNNSEIKMDINKNKN